MEEERKPIITEFNLRMKMAGHSEGFRRRVTSAALFRHSKMLLTEEEGGRKLYRNKEEILISRKNQKLKKSSSGWFRSRDYNAILRVQNTPGGVLAKRIKKLKPSTISFHNQFILSRSNIFAGLNLN